MTSGISFPLSGVHNLWITEALDKSASVWYTTIGLREHVIRNAVLIHTVQG